MANEFKNKKKGKNKGLFVILGITIVIIGLFLALMSLNTASNNKKTEKNSELLKEYTNKSKKDLHQSTIDIMDDSNYKYVTSPEKIAKMIKEKKDIYVYAFSPECPHCQAFTPVLNKVMKDKNIDNVYFLNVLEYPEETVTYKIEYTPTMMHYKDGKEFNRFVGDIGEDKAIKYFDNKKID